MSLQFYKWGLGTKFSLTLFAVVCVVAVTISISVIRIGERAMNDELRERGIAAASILSRLSMEHVMREQLWELYELAKVMAKSDSAEKNIISYAMVLDRDGRLLGHSDPLRFNIGSVPDRDKIIGSGGTNTIDTETYDGEPVFEASSPIILDGQRIGMARVGVTKRYMHEALRKQEIAVFLISSILALCCLISGLLIARRMTRPLKELDANMKALSDGISIEDRVVVSREKDEIGRLADTFNLMTKRLREKERELVKSERLASVGEFAAGLAHEIRNPLGSIVTAVDILGSKDKEDKTSTTLRGVVKKEADRLNQILTDFLIFARPEPPRVMETNLNEILNETVDMLSWDSQLMENIEVELDLDRGMKPLMLDQDQIRQVVWNILINSVQAMGGSGILAISSRAMDEKAVIGIKDTGPGIDEKELERIFEPFYTTKQNGTGLGLSIVSRIVEAHGGRISVESKVGEWTRFTLEFPA